MKKTFTLLMVLFFGLSTFAQEKGYEEGVLRIKFENNVTSKLDASHAKGFKNIIKADAKGFVSLGISSLDALNKKYEVVEMKRIFRSAGKFEQKHREFGLHLWYDVKFRTKTDASKAVAAYIEDVNINKANPKYNVKLNNDGVVQLADLNTLNGTNDPKFNDQWHYENTGQNSGTAGADISLLEAWTVETGNANVIVAIEDGGVDFDHEDLAGNMWINPGEIAGNGIDDDNNGYVDDIYGYNFGDDTGAIFVGDHGTHVAGTVAAETNNGIGVSGVAGGSGNNDGVRLMSCNVFAQGTDGFAEAFSYAADNGAAISQNSWGYTSKGVYDQAVLDGIDYFRANGGGEAMDGGIVIFAAGNDGSSGEWWPGYYENTLSVAATNKNDEKSYYSNYDTWVDIAAPGGELESTNDDPTAIHSTLPNNQYGVMQGTSMACPHVSGVAALVVSNNYGNITAAELWSKLVDNTDNIDAQNSTYLGKLGSGRLNAYAALTGESSGGGGGTTNPVYCTSKGGNSSYEWIASVTVGDFTNASAAAGYTDFTSKTVTLAPGANVAVSLQPGFASSSYNEYWKIWIDYNGDADFDDAGELVFDAGALSKTTVTGNFDVAANATGTTRMRVSMKYNAAQTACESFSYGEVEDYTVEFSAGTGGDTQAPTAPANLTASNITQTTVDLNWSASSDNVGVAAYEVFQNGTSLGTVTATSAQITGMTANTSYSFYVKAQDAAGNVSSASNTINVTTLEAADTQAPTAPSNLTSANITQTTVDLSWSASSDNKAVTGYDVYRNGALLGSVTGTSTQVTGLTANTAYSFYVKAKDAAGNVSAQSNTVNVTTLAEPTGGDCYASAVAFSLTFDNYPAETSWDVKDATGTVVYSGSGYSAKNATITASFDLSDGDYTFTIYDSYGDGISGSYGNGSYTLTDAEGVQIVTGGAFGASEATDFCISGSGSTPPPTGGGEMPTGYCASKGSNASYEYIDLVQLGSINHTSGNDGGYKDNTAMSTTLELGSSQTVYFSAGFKSSSYTEYWAVYIDFNRDGDFEDSGEKVTSGSSTSSATLSGAFTVPATASLGTTRMRVSMKYNAAQTACETFSYGEVEDYAVELVAAGTSTAPFTFTFAEELGQEEAYSVYPNPTVDVLNLKLSEMQNVTVEIFSASGKRMTQRALSGEMNQVNVSELPTGVYTLSINDGRTITNKSFVKH